MLELCKKSGIETMGVLSEILDFMLCGDLPFQVASNIVI